MPVKQPSPPGKDLVRQIQSLRADLQTLKERRLGEDNAELRGMLRRRGLEPFRANPGNHLLFPPGFTDGEKGRFYDLFKKYSFRLFLREILNRQGIFRIPEVVRFSSLETGEKYLRCLLDLGMVASGEDLRYRFLFLPTASLGPTLEWFMAEVFRKEFFCPAFYGLRFKGTRCGGDFDVVSAMEGRLIYMEVKSSPPKNIEGDEVHEFFGRLEDLQPHLAFFFVDTELRLKDKIVPLFEAEWSTRNSRPGEYLPPVERIADEIFFLDPALYLLSSKRSIVRNLAVCFRHFFTFSSAAVSSPWLPLRRIG